MPAIGYHPVRLRVIDVGGPGQTRENDIARIIPPMTMHAAPATAHDPIEFRLVRRIALSPAAVAAAAASLSLLLIWGAYYISATALVAGSRNAGWSLAPQAHAGLLASVLLGYVAGAAKYLAQSGSAWPAIDIARSRWGGATGLLAGVIAAVLTIEDIRTLEPDRQLLTAGEAALNIVFLALFWAVGRAGYFAVVSVMRPTTIATVDLLDLRPLYTHGREQLRSALVWLIGASLFVLIMLFDPNPAVQADSVKVVGPMLAGFVLLAITMILLPLRRIWMSIRTAKASALASAMADLQALRAMSHAPPGREADLLARREYVAGLSEWPFDAASVGTFAFYILLPFLTWIAATFAKQLFDTVFMEKVIKAILGVLG